MSIAPQIRHTLRQAGAFAAAVLPARYKIRAERYLRGWEEHRLLRDSDIVVVSFGKSGRTWLRVLLSRFYQLRYRLPAESLLHNDSLHRLNAAIPRVLFTHDNYLADFTGTAGSKSDYAGKRIVLLIRNPADVAVSQFFQWQHRMSPRKKLINAYPMPERPLAVADFVLDETSGVPKVIRFMNQWASALDAQDGLLVVRYESLHAATAQTLEHILDFMGEKPALEELAECARFAAAENMRALEKQSFFRHHRSRLRPADPENPESYKVRRAKVNGYVDYLPSDQAAQIGALIIEKLSPVYGYGAAAADHRIV